MSNLNLVLWPTCSTIAAHRGGDSALIQIKCNQPGRVSADPFRSHQGFAPTDVLHQKQSF